MHTHGETWGLAEPFFLKGTDYGEKIFHPACTPSLKKEKERGAVFFFLSSISLEP